MKVPAIIACSIIFFALGLAIGAVGAAYLGFTTEGAAFWKKAGDAEAGDVPKGPMMPPDAKGPGQFAPKGGPGVPGGPGGPGGKGGKGGKGPSAKAQLNTLVTKLDILTQKPLTVNLDADEKKQVREQLKGLGELDQLTEDDAKQRLDGLLKALESQKEPLEAAGIRWPGSVAPGTPSVNDAPNPFKDERSAKHLQALEQRLGNAGS
jgi:hypothetical protein